MPFPISTAAEILARAEGRAETALAALAAARGIETTPAAISRAVRSPRGVTAMLLRTSAMQAYEGHLHLGWWGDQYFPDRAETAQLERHASIWGLTRRPATRAVGKVVVTGAPGTPVPAGLQLAGDALYETTASVVVGGGSTATLPVRALDAGTAGNAAAATRLTIVVPVPGLTAQEAVVDSDGLAGGAGVEGDASLLARLLARIREPARGGAEADYPVWLANAFATAQVRAIGGYAGRGRVGVVVAMGSAEAPRAPIPAELDAMAAYLETLRPATAEVIMVAATIAAVALTIALDPDEAAVRAAVTDAIAAHFAAEAAIGVEMPLSRLSEAISAAGGEYAHRLIAPAADIAPGPTGLPVPGAITWVA